MRLLSQIVAITLWNLRAADHAEAFAEGLCSVTHAEYQRRLGDAQAEFGRQGVPVMLVEASPAALLHVLREQNWPNDPDHRAAAIGLIAARHLGRASSPSGTE